MSKFDLPIYFWANQNIEGNGFFVDISNPYLLEIQVFYGFIADSFSTNFLFDKVMISNHKMKNFGMESVIAVIF